MSLAEVNEALDEIKTGIGLTKCQQCGCMQETLDQIHQVLPQLPLDDGGVFTTEMPGWLAKMKATRYSCLGCEHCFAGSAQNAFTAAFPQVADSFGLSCEIQINENAWPPVVGEYVVVDAEAPVGVVTLASLGLPKKISDRHPEGLAITGKLETENIGVEKLLKNVIANQHLQFLLIVGSEVVGHQSGQTLLALAENGLDSTGRVIGSRGKRPVLKNVTVAEVEAFRKQVSVIDCIGCEDLDRITGIIQDLAKQVIEQPIAVEPCGCSGGT